MEPIHISPIDRLGRVEPPIIDERAESSTADVAFDQRELLVQLADLLGHAVRGRPEQRSEPWAEGELFSFDRRVQAEWDSANGPRHQTIKREAGAIWEAIVPLASMTVDTLTCSLTARRIARAVPGLAENAASLAEQMPPLLDLVDLLAVEDDAVFLILHPSTERGFRVQVAGIENNFQLQVLLADLLAGDDLVGRLPAERPDPRVVAAYRGEARQQGGLVGRATFGMYSAGALRADLRLPEGLAGCDHWLWGAASPASIPYFDGERVILLGPPPFRMTWEVERRFPRLRGDARLVEVLDREGVRSWLLRLVRPETPSLGSRSTF